MQLNKEQEIAVSVYDNMARVLVDPKDRRPEIAKIDLGKDGSNITAFFTAELLALELQFKDLTGNDTDLPDFISVLNRLAIQYLLKTNKEDK